MLLWRETRVDVRTLLKFMLTNCCGDTGQDAELDQSVVPCGRLVTSQVLQDSSPRYVMPFSASELAVYPMYVVPCAVAEMVQKLLMILIDAIGNTFLILLLVLYLLFEQSSHEAGSLKRQCLLFALLLLNGAVDCHFVNSGQFRFLDRVLQARLMTRFSATSASRRSSPPAWASWCTWCSDPCSTSI